MSGAALNDDINFVRLGSRNTPLYTKLTAANKMVHTVGKHRDETRRQPWLQSDLELSPAIKRFKLKLYPRFATTDVSSSTTGAGAG